MIKDMAGELSHGQMDVNMKVNGRMVIRTVLEYVNLRKDLLRKISMGSSLGRAISSLSRKRLLSERKS